MLHFDTEILPQTGWTVDDRPESPTIARNFLSDEGSLLRLTGDVTGVANRIGEFLRGAGAEPLLVERAASGDILLRAGALISTILLTGRTAGVLGRYLDHQPVRMSERREMTQRLQAQTE